MAIIDTFKANTTGVEVPSCHPSFTEVPNNFCLQFSWPADLSGLERIMLSAHGDLQRLLRFGFALPLSAFNILKRSLVLAPSFQTALTSRPSTLKRRPARTQRRPSNP
jgi:hypothetical protein